MWFLAHLIAPARYILRRLQVPIVSLDDPEPLGEPSGPQAIFSRGRVGVLVLSYTHPPGRIVGAGGTYL